jgi:hypothetical protein
MRTYTPNVVIVCWDGGAPEYRYEYCPTYKQRDHSDDDTYEDFLEQVIELQDVLPYFGVTSVRKIGAEADDLMYQAAVMLTGSKVIMTTDQDLYQAIFLPDTTVYSPTKDIEVTKDNFTEATDGVAPDWETWMTYRAMVGDSSDGIPGCHGIGHKYALNILELYGSSPSTIVNIANGKYSNDGPNTKKMSMSMAGKVGVFGLGGFTMAYKVSRLDHDLCGAKAALFEAFANWQPFDRDEVRAFLAEYLMVSLQEPSFYKLFASLEDPEGQLRCQVRVPRIAPAREALDASGGQLEGE